MHSPDPRSPAPATSAAQAPERRERSTGHYILVLVATLLMAETTTYGVILFYPALPTMSPPLTTAELPWIISATLLVAAALQPLVGKLADVYGRKRLLMTIAVLFVLGSLLGALTDSFALLIVARILQATAVAMPGVIYSFFREYFPRRMVPVVIGLTATNIGVAAIVAPFIAGALLASFSYRSIFWFCAIYMAVTAPILFFVVPELPRTQRQRVDVLGSATLTAGIGLLLLGVSNGATLGWAAGWTLVPLVLGILLLPAFVLVEKHVPEPMIDFGLLTGPAMRNTLAVSVFAALMCTPWGYLAPQILQAPPSPGAGFGLTALDVAGIVAPFGIASALSAPLGGWLARRTSPRTVMLVSVSSGTLSALGMALTHTAVWNFMVFGVLMGIALGFYFAAGPNLVIEAVPERLTGVSTGMQALSSAFAGSVVPVVITAILAANAPADGSATQTSAGFTWVFAVLAVCGAIGVVITLAMRHGRAPATGGAAL